MASGSEMWKDSAAEGWELLAWENQAQWFAKRTDGWTTGGRLVGFDALIRALTNAPLLGWNFYLNLNPTKPCGKYAKKSDVTRWRYVMLDLDPEADQSVSGPSCEPAIATPWQDAAAVFTGRGYQYWLPVWDMPTPPSWAEESMRVLLKNTSVAGWKVDTTCSDLPRRVRCPGSVNLRTGERARILRPPAGVYNPIEPPEGPPPQPLSPLEVGDLTNLTFVSILPHLKLRNLKAFRFATEGWTHPGRHTAAFTFVKTLSEMGIDSERAMRWTLMGAELCNPSSDDDPKFARAIPRIVRQVYR